MPTLTLDDRQAVHDTLMRYVWAMDTGDIDGAVATFTVDGEVKDVTGKRWDRAAGGPRGFATHFLTRPDRPTGQHLVQPMFVEDAGAGAWRFVSYWSLLVWEPGTAEKSVRLLGSYRDTVVQLDGRWLVREKVIDPWNAETVRALHGAS